MDFDNRKKGFEKKFELDQEQKFKVGARTAKLFGLWAAGEMGLKDKEADAYAAEVVGADLDRPGHDDVIEKVEKDFQAKGVSISRHRMEKEIAAFAAAAHEQVVGAG